MTFHSPLHILRRQWLGLLPVFATCLSLSAQDSGIVLRYKLHRGDHLIYREVFEQEGRSSEQGFRIRALFLTRLVVLDEAGEKLLAGVQRNRQSAELLEYRERGKDKLAQESPRFQARMAKLPLHFSDANVFSADGMPQMPVLTVREMNSKLLYGVSEIEPVPAAGVHAGAETQGAFSLTMRLAGLHSSANGPCAELVDTGTRKEMHLSYTFCPQLGVLEKLDFKGEYHELGDSVIQERATLELVEIRHDEEPASWLSDAQARQGALRAYLIANTVAPDPSGLEKLLWAGDPDVEALTLAVYYQMKLTPPRGAVTALAASKDPEVQRLASRLMEQSREQPTGPCALPVQHYDPEKPGTTLRGMTAPGFEGTPYMMHVPIDYRGDEPFPLIVYLSGGGGLAFDGAYTAEGVLGRSGYLAVYPHAAGAMWWEAKPAAMVHALLLQILRSYNIDTNRVYLAGFSNGASGALYYSTLWPDRLTAVASLMGTGVNSPGGETLPLQNILNVPLLLVHGDKDLLIPSSASVTTYEELRALHPSVAPELHVLKDRGHDITLSSDDGYTALFLLRFRRNPFPRSLSMKISDPDFPRRYWTELMEKGKGPAEVEGRILPGNVIEIKTRNVRKLRLLLRPELLDSTDPVRVRLNGKEQPAQKLTHSCDLFAHSAEVYADPFLAYTEEIVLDVPK